MMPVYLGFRARPPPTPQIPGSLGLSIAPSLDERGLSHLSAVPQRLVGEHDRHHGFAHRHGADADAGIMAALGDDLGFGAGFVDGAARSKNGRGRLDRKARHDRLAGRDAAQDAAGMVGEEYRL